jgi:drug/metabolite transporter (DMT)-like permease
VSLPAPRPTRSLLNYALFALVCAIFSGTWLAIKVGLADFPPLGFAGLRFLLAFPILFALARAQHLPWPARAKDWRIPLILGCTMFALPFGLIYFAERTVPSGLASVLFASHAIFVALLAHFWLPDERLNPARTLGVLVGFAGVVVLFWDRMSGHASWLGELALLATAAIQATSSILIRRTQRANHPIVLSCIGAGVAAICLLAASALFEGRFVDRWTLPGTIALLYLTLFGSVVAFTLTIHLLHELGATRVASIVYITPVAALLWGYLILGEPVGDRLALGIALVVFGVWLTNRASRRPQAGIAATAQAPGT